MLTKTVPPPHFPFFLGFLLGFSFRSKLFACFALFSKPIDILKKLPCLIVLVPLCRNNSAIRAKTYGAITAASNGNNIRPAFRVALSLFISCSNHGAVGTKTHDVITAWSDGNNIRPAFRVAPFISCFFGFCTIQI